MRIRWAGLNVDDVGLRKLVRWMQGQPYSTEEDAGFRLESVSKSSVTGRFIERVEWTDNLEVPFGDSVAIPRVDYRVLRFSIGLVQPALEMIDPPRTCNAFFNGMTEALAGDLAVSQVDVAPMAWLQALERNVGRVLVESLDTSPISVANDTSAVVSINGKKDVRKRLSEFVGDRPHTVHRLSFTATSRSESLECELGGRGRAVVQRGSETIALPLLRVALQDAIKAMRS